VTTFGVTTHLQKSLGKGKSWQTTSFLSTIPPSPVKLVATTVLHKTVAIKRNYQICKLSVRTILVLIVKDPLFQRNLK
jgi:predicted GIY-YIG superfamily endonuclease